MMRSSWNTAALAVGALALVILVPWLIHELRTLPASPALAARGAQRVVTLDVGGMTCGGCSAVVKAKLVSVPGVSTVDVRYRERRAFIVCEKSVADTALTAAVGRAGPGFLAAVAQN